VGADRYDGEPGAWEAWVVAIDGEFLVGDIRAEGDSLGRRKPVGAAGKLRLLSGWCEFGDDGIGVGFDSDVRR
jgi:hypothetical protein